MQDKLTKQQEQIRENGELILDENKEKHISRYKYKAAWSVSGRCQG